LSLAVFAMHYYLVRAAGVRQSHLTYYFPTRTDLLQEVARHSIGALMAQLGQVTDAPGSLSEGIAAATADKNMVAGVYASDSGEIVFQKKRIDGLRPDQVCAAGIGRTFQLVKPFVGLCTTTACARRYLGL